MSSLYLIKEQDFVVEVTESSVFITGTVITFPELGNNWINKDLFVRCYHVVFNNDLNIPGKSIHIATKELEIGKAIKISVTGKDATEYLVAANNGRSFGADGQPGKGGKKGMDGGNITIIADRIFGAAVQLLAEGGQGGKGQNGGNGHVGATGANARDRTKSRRDTGSGRTGGTGGKGGAPGKGGDGGAGGNGGIVRVYVDDMDCDVTISTKSGNGGEAGANGAVGKGGKGGLGGKGMTYTES